MPPGTGFGILQWYPINNSKLDPSGFDIYNLLMESTRFSSIKTAEAGPGSKAPVTGRVGVHPRAAATALLGLMLAPALLAQRIGPVTRITPDLYTAVREDGVHCVMERIDDGAAMPMHAVTSPIAVTRVPDEIRIYAKDRKTVVFDWKRDGHPPTITVGGHLLSGEATRAFDWFAHPHLPLEANPCLTVNLDALARLSEPRDPAP
jgi:hypothetical protein